MPPKRQTRAAKRSLDFSEEPKQSQAGKDDHVVDLTGEVTPQKKKKKRDLNDFFGSPTTTAASTPAAKSSSSAAIVTPQEASKRKQKVKKDEDEKKEAEYVPTYLHKNVEYLRKGKAKLSQNTQKIFDLVESHFVIPEGFEYNRSFGPLSGVSFEERVIAAYSNNLLKPRAETDEGIAICTCCASEGHKRDDCPTLI